MPADLESAYAAFNARGVATMLSFLAADFDVDGRRVRLPFGSRVSQRTMERYGFIESVTALAILPDTVDVRVREGDRLTHVDTGCLYRIEQITTPQNAAGKLLGLQRLRPEA